VRENYHSGLLIGNDNKMNGRLNSEAAGRKTLHSADFGPHESPAYAMGRRCSFEPLDEVLPGESSQTLRLREFMS
jgi:hypothetical protein